MRCGGERDVRWVGCVREGAVGCERVEGVRLRTRGMCKGWV